MKHHNHVPACLNTRQLTAQNHVPVCLNMKHQNHVPECLIMKQLTAQNHVPVCLNMKHQNHVPECLIMKQLTAHNHVPVCLNMKQLTAQMGCIPVFKSLVLKNFAQVPQLLSDNQLYMFSELGWEKAEVLSPLAYRPGKLHETQCCGVLLHNQC